MNNNNLRSIAMSIIAIFLFGVASCASAGDNIILGNIMPLGDSITYGSGGTDAGYRGPLYNLLTSANATFQFVGDSTLNSGSLPVNQTQHAGHSSYATFDIENNLDGLDTTIYDTYGGAERDPNGGYWITGGHDTGRDAIAPDIFLLLVGTNDVLLDKVSDAEANITNLLTKLTTLVPSASILIAKIPPSTLYPTRVDSWNLVVDDVSRGFQNVTLVDLNTNFPSGGLSHDGVHPNDIGYNWMAEQWKNIAVQVNVLLDGDANHDGVVSAGDYISVQSFFGNTGAPGILGDADADGFVSAGDFASVQSNYGNTAAPVEVVPEPSTMALLSLGAVTCFTRRRLHLKE